jgi:hypothetical protein
MVKPARHTANNKLHVISDAVCTVPATAVSKPCARSGYEASSEILPVRSILNTKSMSKLLSSSVVTAEKSIA